MLGLSTIIIHPNRTHTLHTAALFRPAIELLDLPRVRTYLSISKPGWSRGEFGHWNYTRQHSNGDLHIYPALTIADKDPPRKFRSETTFLAEDIELYASQLEELTDAVQLQLRDEFNLLVHDLRHLSTSIYHAAEEGLNALNINDTHEVRTRLQNIIGSQSMLRIRTDALDYSGNADLFNDTDEVPIYRKVDKVCRSFSPTALKKNIRIHLSGSSFGRSIGPDVFEIIPYSILDNAIKYSPNGNDITVTVEETNHHVHVRFQSVGPLIDPDELDEVFARGVRGRHAMLSGVQGSGVGLALAKRLVDQFSGSISARTTGSIYQIAEQRFTDVEFTIRLPVVEGSGIPAAY